MANKFDEILKPYSGFLAQILEEKVNTEVSKVKAEDIANLSNNFKEGSLTVDQAIKIAMMGALEIKILKEENQSLKADIAALKSKVGV